MEIELHLRKLCGDMAWVLRKNSELNEEVLCGACLKPILGSFLSNPRVARARHPSCFDLPTKMESLLFHFSSGHDDLNFTGELENKVKEDAVCIGCEERVVGPGYKYPAPECKLLLHESCTKLPLEMQHALHPDHPLSLMRPRNNFCNVCGKNCKECFFHQCVKCKFNLDIRCATCFQTDSTDDCRHIFRSLVKRIQFTCDACGEKGVDLAAQCKICQLLIHGQCTRFSHTMKITIHQHSLVRTYSIRQVKENRKIFCNLCRKEVKTEYGAYFCKRCDYVAHLNCAYKFRKIGHEESVG